MDTSTGHSMYMNNIVIGLTGGRFAVGENIFRCVCVDVFFDKLKEDGVLLKGLLRSDFLSVSQDVLEERKLLWKAMSCEVKDLRKWQEKEFVPDAEADEVYTRAAVAMNQIESSTCKCYCSGCAIYAKKKKAFRFILRS